MTAPENWRPWAPWLALLLWIASLLLGMQAVYDTLQLFYLVAGVFGSLAAAQTWAAVVLCLMGLLLIAVVLGSAEYHRTRVDQPQSWRLFAWTLGGELAILSLRAFLF